MHFYVYKPKEFDSIKDEIASAIYLRTLPFTVFPWELNFI